MSMRMRTRMQMKATGQVLWEAVCKKLHLLEADYFDLEFLNTNSVACWLDRAKLVFKQTPPNTGEARFSFVVKFFPPDPHLLDDEFTRYLFALQIKRDLQAGQLACSETTAALLSAYIVQAEMGDYLEDVYQNNISYLQHLRLIPDQSIRFLNRVLQLHKALVGMGPAETDYHLLDTVRKCEFYGLRLYPAKDHEGIAMTVSVAHNGIIVLQNMIKINLFSWAKIRKISFKRKKFIIKLHADTCNFYNDLVEFFYATRDECKNFWKACIEHHTFFRCHSANERSNSKTTTLVTTGSTYRYCGRTQKELTEYVRENYVKRPPFVRVSSANYVKMQTMAPAAARYNSGNPSSYLGAGGSQSAGSVSFRITTTCGTTASARSHTSTATSGSHTFDEDDDDDADADDDDAQHRRQQKRRTLELMNARAGRKNPNSVSKVSRPAQSGAQAAYDGAVSHSMPAISPMPLKSNLKRTSETTESQQTIDYGGVFVGEVPTDSVPEWLRSTYTKRQSQGTQSLSQENAVLHVRMQTDVDRIDGNSVAREAVKSFATNSVAGSPQRANAASPTEGRLSVSSHSERPFSPPASFAESPHRDAIDSNLGSVFSPPQRSPSSTPIGGGQDTLSKDILFVTTNIQRLIESSLDDANGQLVAQIEQTLAQCDATIDEAQRALVQTERAIQEREQVLVEADSSALGEEASTSPPTVAPPKVLSPSSSQDCSTNEAELQLQSETAGDTPIVALPQQCEPLVEVVEPTEKAPAIDLDSNGTDSRALHSSYTDKSQVNIEQIVGNDSVEDSALSDDAVTYVLNKRVVLNAALQPRSPDRTKLTTEKQKRCSSSEDRDSYSDSDSFAESLCSANNQRPPHSTYPDDRNVANSMKQRCPLSKQKRRRREGHEKSSSTEEDWHAPATHIKSPKLWRAEYMNQQRQLALQRLDRRSQAQVPKCPEKTEKSRSTSDFYPPFEYVNVYRLPPLDSYSCVDDTVAVDNFQAEIQQRIQHVRMKKQKQKQQQSECVPNAELHQTPTLEYSEKAESETCPKENEQQTQLSTLGCISETRATPSSPQEETSTGKVHHTSTLLPATEPTQAFASLLEGSECDGKMPVDSGKNDDFANSRLTSLESDDVDAPFSPMARQSPIDDLEASGAGEDPKVSTPLPSRGESPGDILEGENATADAEANSTQHKREAQEQDESNEPHHGGLYDEDDEDEFQCAVNRYEHFYGRLVTSRFPEIEPDDEAQYEEETRDDEIPEESIRVNLRSIPQTRYYVGRYDNATQDRESKENDEECEEDSASAGCNVVVTANTRELYALDEESSDDLRQYDDGENDSDAPTDDDDNASLNSPPVASDSCDLLQSETDNGATSLTVADAVRQQASANASVSRKIDYQHASICEAHGETPSYVSTITNDSLSNAAALSHDANANCADMVDCGSLSPVADVNTQRNALATENGLKEQEHVRTPLQSINTSFPCENDSENDENSFPPPPEFLLQMHTDADESYPEFLDIPPADNNCCEDFDEQQ